MFNLHKSSWTGNSIWYMHGWIALNSILSKAVVSRKNSHGFTCKSAYAVHNSTEADINVLWKKTSYCLYLLFKEGSWSKLLLFLQWGPWISANYACGINDHVLLFSFLIQMCKKHQEYVNRHERVWWKEFLATFNREIIA